MKIGIDARMYGKGVSGIGTYVQQLTEQIFNLDKDNDYYLFLLEPQYSQYICPGPNIHKVKTTARWYSLAEQTLFLADLLKHNLDLVHFPHFNAPIFYNKKRVTTIHDLTPKFFPGHKQKSSWRKKAYELTMKTSLKKAAEIITISQFTKADIIKHFAINPEHIQVIYLGIEKHFIPKPDYAKIKAIKDQYGIAKPFLFFISAWRNHKNFIGLINAFAILKTKYNLDYQLVLGGQEDSYYTDISQAISASPFKADIITPGFIADEDLPSFYQAANLYVTPSLYEGFGLTGLEALSCGTPVVSANTTSLPEILGPAALYFDPHNIENMAQVIYQGATDQVLRNKLQQIGFEQIKKYSWQDCAQKTLALYQQILKQD